MRFNFARAKHISVVCTMNYLIPCNKYLFLDNQNRIPLIVNYIKYRVRSNWPCRPTLELQSALQLLTVTHVMCLERNVKFL